MSAACLRALALLALLSSAAACSKRVQSSVQNVTQLLATASVWPMRLYMANEPAEARIYSCYSMDANYTITFTDAQGNSSYTLKPTANSYSAPTYTLTYQPSKKYSDPLRASDRAGRLPVAAREKRTTGADTVLGASKDGAKIDMQIQALYTDFVMWEGCDESSGTRNYLFMKNGVVKENLDYRCLKTALTYTYSISTVPKGICS